MSFDNLGLEPRLLQAVVNMGYTAPTPIQSAAIPLVLDGRDVVGCAQTGTGKTAAFVLPVLQRLTPRPGAPECLVVTPTRELAIQIVEVAVAAARTTHHRVAAVYGGVGYEPQVKALRRGVDMLVATPGRLLDLAARRDVDLSRIEILVLDEADRMLDMGFWPDVRRILALLPPKRQNLLFSATMSPDVLKVIGSTLDDPAHVSVAPPATPIEAIQQSLYPVVGTQKSDLLIRIIKDRDLDRVLVFTRTKHRADRVAKVLDRAGVRSAAIHGNRSQSQRQGALEGFKRGAVRVLVATDIVARGIDVEGISHVINYDLPNVPDDYVHRIGRTARAGRSGVALSLLAPEEHEALRDIERKIGAVIDCADLAGFDYSHDRVVPHPERTAEPKARPGARQAPGASRGAARGGGSGASRGGSSASRDGGSAVSPSTGADSGSGASSAGAATGGGAGSGSGAPGGSYKRRRRGGSGRR